MNLREAMYIEKLVFFSYFIKKMSFFSSILAQTNQYSVFDEDIKVMRADQTWTMEHPVPVGGNYTSSYVQESVPS